MRNVLFSGKSSGKRRKTSAERRSRCASALFCLFCLFLPALRGSAQTGQPRAEAQREFAENLCKLYPEIAERNLHVVVGIDNSGSMKNNHAALLEIWKYLLLYFFKPGDTFTLIPFHNRILRQGDPDGPDHADKTYPKEASATLADWFFNEKYLQKPGAHGSLAGTARREVLDVAQKRPDKSRVTLTLLITDGNDADTDKKQEDLLLKDRADAKIASQWLRQSFSAGGNEDGDGNKNSGVMARFSYALPFTDGTQNTSTLIIYSAALTASRAAPPQGTLDRRVYVGDLPPPSYAAPPPEPDWRGRYTIFCFLCFCAAAACLSFMRFKITFSANDGSQWKGLGEKNLSLMEAAFHRIKIRARNQEVKDPPREEVWLVLDKAERSAPVLAEISIASPSAAVIEKRDNSALLEKSGTGYQRIDAPYDQGGKNSDVTEIRIGLSESQSGRLRIQPHAWMRGKTWQVYSAACLLIAALGFGLAAALYKPPPPFEAPAAPVARPCCNS